MFLFKEKNSLRDDSLLVVDQGEYAAKFALCRGKGKEAFLEDKIIVRSGANPERYFPTVAGVLLFCEDPSQYIPEAHVICTRFAGTEGRGKN